MQRQGRSGAGLSTKQMARTVVDGRAVTFTLVNSVEVSGFLCGMDDYHWMVVTPAGQRHLVHKAAAILITFADSCSYRSEQRHSALEEIVAPFRRFVERDLMGREIEMESVSA